MTALDVGNIRELFMTNVLGGIVGHHPAPNGGTVERMIITSGRYAPRVLANTPIGSGFPARTDSRLVIGPPRRARLRGTLYVADTLNSRIAGIPGARSGAGRRPGHHGVEGQALMNALGLAIAPNGHILTSTAVTATW